MNDVFCFFESSERNSASSGWDFDSITPLRSALTRQLFRLALIPLAVDTSLVEESADDAPVVVESVARDQGNGLSGSYSAAIA